MSLVERDLLFAGEHPLRFAVSLLALQITLFFLIAVLPEDWLSRVWIGWAADVQITYFSTVWTIQATLAALVYPIVISFVAVYLQRRPVSDAFIHLYMLDSGGLAAGVSSLALVVVMGIQFLAMSSWGIESIPLWAAIDTAWFVLNAVLTTFFLYRTVEFLRPELQTTVIHRYAVNVALPRDVLRLNSGQLLAAASMKGWFLVPSYGGGTSSKGPKLLVGVFHFRESIAQCKLRLPTPARLVDVRIWLVKLVVESWYRKALKSLQPKTHKDFGISESAPLLTLPIRTGTVYEDEITLACVADGPAFAPWQRWLLRWSVTTRPTPRENYGIKVIAIISELAAEARGLAAKPDNEGFERALIALVDLHGLLLAACLDRTESGGIGSWALLPDTESLFERPLHETWLATYRGIFEAAIDALVKDARPLQRLCYLLQRLDGDVLRASPIEIREHLLSLPPMMMYQLGNWWASRVEEQGVVEHNCTHMVLLQPPLNRTYEDVLSSFVAGWENARPGLPRESREIGTLDWVALLTLARLNVKHIEETARMLLSSVQRGDVAAAEWLADVLSKWWGSSDFDHDHHQLYDKRIFITIEDLNLCWPAFCEKFGLDGDDSESIALQHGAYRAALLNYWTDVRLLTVELMLDWVRAVPAPSVVSSLAFETVAGLLTGKQWKSGGEPVHSLASLSSGKYLVAKVRQFAASGMWRGGYVAMLDRFVESVKDMRRPHMLSSRVYSFAGADDVRSLLESQLDLMAVLTTAEWELPHALQRQLDIWFEALDNGYNCIDVLRNRITNWLTRLEDGPGLPVEHIELLKARVRPGVPTEDAIVQMRNGLRFAEEILENRRSKVLADQPIDIERLSKIGCYASDGFSKEKIRFPVHLFLVQNTAETLDDFTLTFPQRLRGEFTQVQMEQRAVNEGDFFADVIAQQLAVVVLNDVLRNAEIKEVAAQDAEAYWKVLQVESGCILAKGQTPILMLDNATRPDWVWDWQHADFGAAYKRPHDLSVRRIDGAGAGYVCNFNDIRVYVAPIPIGQSLLLSNEAFQKLTVTDYGDKRFVTAEVVDVPEKRNLVDLKLTFSRRVEIGEKNVVRLVY